MLLAEMLQIPVVLLEVGEGFKKSCLSLLQLKIACLLLLSKEGGNVVSEQQREQRMCKCWFRRKGKSNPAWKTPTAAPSGLCGTDSVAFSLATTTTAPTPRRATSSKVISTREDPSRFPPRSGELQGGSGEQHPACRPTCSSLLGNRQVFQATSGFHSFFPAAKGWEAQPSPGLGYTEVDSKKSQEEEEEKLFLRYLTTLLIVRCQPGALLQLR